MTEAIVCPPDVTILFVKAALKNELLSPMSVCHDFFIVRAEQLIDVT